MNSVFDYFSKKETPNLILCTPNRVPVVFLKGAYKINHILRFNAISELNFQFPKSLDGGITELSAYSYIKNKMLVLIEGVGYYIITECPETSDGSVPIKEVICQSLEAGLLYRRMTGFELDPVMLYNATNKEDSLLDIVLQYFPGWTISYVDPDLLIDPEDGEETRRMFSVDNGTLYDFLINKVEVAFNCVITFDGLNRTLSAYAIENLNESADVFFSFNNVNINVTITEYSDEMTTCLYCFGNNLDISGANPLGKNAIYNFAYFKTTEWMSQDLIDTITAWETKTTSRQSTYLTYTTNLLAYYIELADLETELAELKAELSGLIAVLKTQRANNISTTETQISIRDQYVAIDSQNKLIFDVNSNIYITEANMKRIVYQLSFTKRKNYEKIINGTVLLYKKFQGIRSSWKTIYNINSTNPQFSIPDFNESYPDIINAFAYTITDFDATLSVLKTTIKSYPTEDISNAQRKLQSLVEDINDLFEYLDNLISGTQMTTDLFLIMTTLEVYYDTMSYEENFSESQYLELQDFIFENTYENENILITDIMKPSQIKSQTRSLYREGVKVLARACYPRYEITGDFANIFFSNDYEDILDKLELGKLVTIEFDKSKIITPVLLEINITYDDPTNFTLVFSNRVRLNRSNFQFSDMFLDSARSSSGVSGL